MVHLRVGQPNPIHWKSFLRVAVPLAVALGLFTAYGPLQGWLILLPVSVFLAIYVYQRRHTGPLKPAQGAKMGAVIVLISFALPVIIVAVSVARDPAGYRQQIENQIKDAVAHNPNPQFQQMAQTMLSGTGGIALVTAVGMTMVLLFLLVIGGASGALATVFFRAKSP